MLQKFVTVVHSSFYSEISTPIKQRALVLNYIQQSVGFLVVGVVCFGNRRLRGASHRGAAREWSEVRRLFPGEERLALAVEGSGPSSVGRGAGGA